MTIYYYTRLPDDMSQSNNGGDYYRGYIVTELTDGTFLLEYNHLLHSDFSSQGLKKLGVFNSIEEARNTIPMDKIIEINEVND